MNHDLCAIFLFNFYAELLKGADHVASIVAVEWVYDFVFSFPQSCEQKCPVGVAFGTGDCDFNHV